ncbi:ABC transporter ATP-binding protein [Thalassotalea piscium]
MSALVSISELSKSYGRTKVLENINLTVNSGQILGLVGPNGAGKTTCLHAILGLADFNGEIKILGLDPRRQREEMLKQVSYISDVAVLPKWLKVSQAIEYMNGVHPNFDQNKALHFLAKTNIKQSAKVSELSKGMITQLHLALILAVDAKILVLDEPTLGLDILTRRQFYTHLLEDFYREDRCIIVTTHQIEEIEHILTDVAFIQEGQIVLSDNIDSIRERFKILTVNPENMEQAKQLKPLFSNSIMGLTTMLFEGIAENELIHLGQVSLPSLADIFVGVMTKEPS